MGEGGQKSTTQTEKMGGPCSLEGRGPFSRPGTEVAAYPYTSPPMHLSRCFCPSGGLFM